MSDKITLRRLLEDSPEGPYHSKFYEKKHFIVKTSKGFRVVADGQQPDEGVLHANRREARAHLRRNGFKKSDV